MGTFEGAQLGHYELSVVIARPPTSVWKALTAETNTWWLQSFRMVGEASVVSLRPEAGGQLIEKREGGGSLLWYTVVMVDPGKSLHLSGHSFPEWGGPTVSLLKLELEAHPSGCRLHVSDSLIGRISEKQLASLRSGWVELFTDGLKKHCER